jgi:hypothetical protein
VSSSLLSLILCTVHRVRVGRKYAFVRPIKTGTNHSYSSPLWGYFFSPLSNIWDQCKDSAQFSQDFRLLTCSSVFFMSSDSSPLYTDIKCNISHKYLLSIYLFSPVLSKLKRLSFRQCISVQLSRKHPLVIYILLMLILSFILYLALKATCRPLQGYLLPTAFIYWLPFVGCCRDWHICVSFRTAFFKQRQKMGWECSWYGGTWLSSGSTKNHEIGSPSL